MLTKSLHEHLLETVSIANLLVRSLVIKYNNKMNNQKKFEKPETKMLSSFEWMEKN